MVCSKLPGTFAFKHSLSPADMLVPHAYKQGKQKRCDVMQGLARALAVLLLMPLERLAPQSPLWTSTSRRRRK